MNEDELETEAKEWIKNNNYPYSNCPNIEKKLKQAYLAGAEPREKLIAELKSEKGCETCTKFAEVQLTKAKVALRNVIDYLGHFFSDYPDCVIEAEQFLNSEVEK